MNQTLKLYMGYPKDLAALILELVKAGLAFNAKQEGDCLVITITGY